MNLLLVKNNFSRFCSTYEKYAFIQKETASILGKEALYGLGIDLGCGTGFLTQALKTDFNRIIGVDLSYEMISYYREKGFEGINANIESLPFRDSSFDFAVSNFSLHWTDINISFKEVNRILKESSIFLFAIPVEDSLKEIYEKLYKTFDFPSEEKIIQTLKSNGFVIYEKYIQNFPLYFKNGKQMLEYFKYTGTAVNQQAKTLGDKLVTYKKVLPLKNITTGFKVLFVKAIKAF